MVTVKVPPAPNTAGCGSGCVADDDDDSAAASAFEFPW
jgi:hypothetical protein